MDANCHDPQTKPGKAGNQEDHTGETRKTSSRNSDFFASPMQNTRF